MIKRFQKILILALLFLGGSFPSLGQIPPGYYDSVDSLYGDTLRFELAKIISGHSVQSYSSLWNHFWNTDRKPDSAVWDMYSDNPGGTPPYVFEFFTDQCGNYSGEGDCYNREHSFPKSWFGDQSPMNTDLFHLFPTDGYTNGQRSNHPYGETNNPSWTSQNGSKRGPSSVLGYSGTVFEPLDEYKGDFARAYFYMVTRYLNKVSNWNSDMLDGNDFDEWAADMLLEWHREDTVSQKELDRNNAVYQIQNNRNPYIDHPAYVELIWGDSVILGDTTDPGDSTVNFLELDGGLEVRILRTDDGLFVQNDGSETAVEVQVFDAFGRKQLHFSLESGDRRPLSLPRGLYLVRMNNARSQTVKKVYSQY